jgi:hypothetical protein
MTPSNELQETSARYLEGFINGFYLEEHAPEIAKTLARIQSEIDYVTGLRDGITEKQYELQQEQINELNNLVKRDDKEKDLEL